MGLNARRKMIGKRVLPCNTLHLRVKSGDCHCLVLMVTFNCAKRSQIYFLTWAGTFRVSSMSWTSAWAMESKALYVGL